MGANRPAGTAGDWSLHGSYTVSLVLKGCHGSFCPCSEGVRFLQVTQTLKRPQVLGLLSRCPTPCYWEDLRVGTWDLGQGAFQEAATSLLSAAVRFLNLAISVTCVTEVVAVAVVILKI